MRLNGLNGHSSPMVSTASTVSTKGAAELLEEFTQTGRQEPFEEIARRYAGMVFNVAMQVTRDAHDAEDATQATFLTLAVHAKTDNKIRYIGPWLRKVSHRLALDIRRSKKRRKAREEKHANGNDQLLNGYDVPAGSGLHAEEVRHTLREELDKLPSKYRMPLILYYFGGLSPDEMGKELGCNTSTLGVRLHRGRKMLADNLASRGITISSTALGAMLAGLVDVFVRDNLVHASASAAAHVGGGFAASASFGAPSLQVVSLMNAARTALSWGRVKALVATALLIASTVAGGAEVLNRFNVIDFSVFRSLNLQNLLRPLLDKLHFSPQFTAVDAPKPSVGTAKDATPAAFGVASGLSLSLSSWAVNQVANFTAATVFAAVGELELPRPLTLASWETTPNASSSTLFAMPASNAAALAKLELSPGTLPPALPYSALAYSSSTVSGSAAVAVITSTPIHPNVVIDSASASAAPTRWNSGVYALNTLTVGQSARGQFTQNGGLVQIDDALTLGAQAKSSGAYMLNGGTLAASRLVIGDAGAGTLVVNNGVVRGAADGLAVATLTLGSQAGSDGTLALNGGTLMADHLVIGDHGAGTLLQAGGVAMIHSASLGENADGSGTWSLAAGTIRVGDASNGGTATAAALVIGNQGLGTLLVRPKDNGAALVDASSTGAGLTIRAKGSADGILRGWGRVALGGTLVENGRVVADGFGVHHLLDLSSAASVVNSIDNAANGGANGWYARDGGDLLLPALKIVDNQPATWGEDAADTTLDLVNSARLTPHGVAAGGTMSLTLLDPAFVSTPDLPTGAALSIYAVNSSAQFASLDYVIRYDDAQAALLGITEAQLGIWIYNNGWQTLDASSTGVDVAGHTVWGTGGTGSYIAVGVVPEPATLMLLGNASALMLFRRRRRK